MKRIAHISDQHFDATSRWEECRRVARWIRDDIARRGSGGGIDLITLGGDLFERRSTPEERNAAAEWIVGLAEVAPVVGVYGNHDAPGDLDLFTRLQTVHAVHFYSRPAIIAVRGIAVACLPWPRKAHLMATGAEATNPADALRAVLRGLGHELERISGVPDYPRVMLGHVMVRGSTTSAGQPLVGCDFEVGLEDLALVGADAYLLGHVHRGQTWWIEREGRNRAPVVYPGSPRRTAYGEVEPKCYVDAVISKTDNESPAVFIGSIETPAAPMLLLEGVFDPAYDDIVVTVTDGWNSDKAGADIRLRYEVDADQIDAARRAADANRLRLLAAGAIAVKLEAVVRPRTRARAPEITEARTLQQKLRAYWEARGEVPDQERAARLLAMAEELEVGS